MYVCDEDRALREIATTRDDAAGEAFDKIGRVIGMPYPGGAALDKAASMGNETKYELPLPKPGANPYDMSFSGLKTAVINLAHTAEQKGEAVDRASLAASFCRAVSDSLVPRTMDAVRALGYDKLAVAGGVAANSRIRGDFQKACDNLRHRSVLEKYEKGSRYKGSTGISESEESYTLYERELTIDPSSASVILCFDYSEPADDVEEDVILYTVTNADGQITGAGGLYVGKKYVDGPNPRTPGRAVTISRAAVLGSVRFIDPASVTEAQVEALHSTYAEEGKNGQSMVDFTPVTHEEINAVAGREILDTLFKNQFVMGIGRGISYYADYSSFYVLTEDSDYEHEFIVFKDGTWAEIDCERGANASSNGHANAECPNTETNGHHGIGIGCIVKTTDGRFYQLDGKTATLIEDPTA